MSDRNADHNPPRTRKRRRTLRRELTPAEKRLWSKLRAQQLADAKFRRQHGVDSYVLDFYCHEVRLAIEVDGDSHFIGEGEMRDAVRTEHLKRCGIAVLRFTNVEIYRNLDGVLRTIYEAILERRGEEPSP